MRKEGGRGAARSTYIVPSCCKGGGGGGGGGLPGDGTLILNC